MSALAIKAENLSKAYRLGEIGTGTISRDLERWFAKVRGKEDPFLTIGETNDRTRKGTSDVVWSLKDINFEIKQGDAVGIIGRNGAGKSTLLKLLSRVTTPTSGAINVKGRIASLLEVGTGFHPELTGRENIYLNGAILGMRKKEIKRKFDEIVDFAGVERYIDTPVKRYSSGMYVRLAFAVAAHLESEILIVDEVLAVGDAEFQRKCLGKMGEVSKGEGRTVLFVSHNMASITELCHKGIYLQNGNLANFGGIKEVIDSYFNSDVGTIFINQKNDVSTPEITYAAINEKELEKGHLQITFNYKSPFSLNPAIFGIVVYNSISQPLFTTNARIHPGSYDFSKNSKEGRVSLLIPNLPLISGDYSISLWLGDMEVDYNSYLHVLKFQFFSNAINNSRIPNFRSDGSINLFNSAWLSIDDDEENSHNHYVKLNK